MIGNYLQDENGVNGVNDEKQNEAEQASVADDTNRTDDVLSIPQVRPTEPALQENRREFSAFRDGDEVIEAIPLPENQENYTLDSSVTDFDGQSRISYTVAPPDAFGAVQNSDLAVVQTPTESPEVNLRRTGLAWSAATVLGGSVVFMLVIGWFFDLVFGSKPWGVVGGIVLGAMIGFVQFFRITSRIFKTEDTSSLGIK